MGGVAKRCDPRLKVVRLPSAEEASARARQLRYADTPERVAHGQHARLAGEGEGGREREERRGREGGRGREGEGEGGGGGGGGRGRGRGREREREREGEGESVRCNDKVERFKPTIHEATLLRNRYLQLRHL